MTYEEKKFKTWNYALALLIILLGIASRFFPHPYNFSPVAAIALFGGVYLQKKIAIFLPMLILFISDIFIGFYEPAVMISVYGSFVLCAIIGFWLKNNKRWQTILGSSLAASVIFFFITNFAVWAFTPWYEKSLSGLIQCYYLALPFFRNTLLGDLVYVSLFFMAYENIAVWIKKRVMLSSPLKKEII